MGVSYTTYLKKRMVKRLKFLYGFMEFLILLFVDRVFKYSSIHFSTFIRRLTQVSVGGWINEDKKTTNKTKTSV